MLEFSKMHKTAQAKHAVTLDFQSAHQQGALCLGQCDRVNDKDTSNDLAIKKFIAEQRAARIARFGPHFGFVFLYLKQAPRRVLLTSTHNGRSEHKWARC